MIDDRRGVDDLVEEAIDQDQLVERFLEGNVDQVDGHPTIAKRLVEENIDAGKGGEHFKDSLEAGVLSEAQVDRRRRGRLEHRLRREKLTSLLATLFELRGFLSPVLPLGECLSSVDELLLGVLVRPIELVGERKLLDRLLEILARHELARLLDVELRGLPESPLERHAVLDVVRVFTGGPRVVHHGGVPVSLFRLVLPVAEGALGDTAASQGPDSPDSKPRHHQRREPSLVAHLV